MKRFNFIPKTAIITALLLGSRAEAQTATATATATAPISNGASVYSGYLYHNSNVGIGTTNPTAHLQIYTGWLISPDFAGDMLRVDGAIFSWRNVYSSNIGFP